MAWIGWLLLLRLSTCSFDMNTVDPYKLRFYPSLIRSPRIGGIPVGIIRPLAIFCFCLVQIMKPVIGNFAWAGVLVGVAFLAQFGEEALTRWDGNIKPFLFDILRERPYVAHKEVQR